MIIDPDTPSDEKLAGQAKEGSLESFEELVRRYEGRLYRFLARAARNDEDGSDLTQETFVTAYTKLHRYDPAQSFGAWIFTIARRKCIDHLRARKTVGECAAPESIDENTPAELAARSDEQSDLWQHARGLLTEIQFHALWVKYVEELTVAEIAQALRRTRTHVKVILFRARAALAQGLDAQRREVQRPTNSTNPGSPANSGRELNARQIL